MNRLHVFAGPEKPKWDPSIALESDPRCHFECRSLRPSSLPKGFDEFYFVCDHFLSEASCVQLIESFETQEKTPVGVDGYADAEAGSRVGSVRTNAWSVSIAEQLSSRLKPLLSAVCEFRKNEEIGAYEASEKMIRLPFEEPSFRFLGTTPFMRFMKYQDGGMHIPHYDAPFENRHDRYVTLFSWVLFLNSPGGEGGNFEFVDDQQWAKAPHERDRSDWRRMAETSEILGSVAPRAGRLLVLPHWLPHQVQAYSAKPGLNRYIIRGDLAYEY